MNEFIKEKEAFLKDYEKVKLTNIFSLKSNWIERLEKAYLHAQENSQLNEAIFPYQEFSLCMQDLFDIALGKSILSFKKEHVERCFEHMLFHKQENHTYWSYQQFSFTLFEILEECMRKVNPQAIIEIKQDMRSFHKEYGEFSDNIKYHLHNNKTKEELNYEKII